MADKYTAPRGTMDFTYPRSANRQRVVERACGIAALHGYRRIETPVIENTGLFVRSIGEETDIVGKEMFSFTDRGGESLTLRPEGTAPVVRAYLQRGLSSEGLPQKLYYEGPMFRRERPQAGRFRQFHQVGAEAIGSRDPLLDAEIVYISKMLFTELGLSRYELLLNSIGCRECRPGFLDDLIEFLGGARDSLCDTCSRRARLNPLRVFDCKEEGCRAVLEGAPTILDAICGDCATHFAALRSGLEELGVDYTVDPWLVRGLDYYARTTFEYRFEGIGAQDTVSAGGRYDYLAEQLGGPPTPGVGFSLGVERLEMCIKAQGIEPFAHSGLDVFVAAAPGLDPGRVTEFLRDLRRGGVSADSDFMGRSLKAQLKHADRLSARLVVIMGPDELERGKVVFRDLQLHEQWEVPVEDAAARALSFVEKVCADET